MPLARRKKVVLTKDDASLSTAAATTPVYLIPQTGEIFTDYEAYVSRVSFYRLRIFQCEVTGKGNLTFFDALDSEKQEAKMLQSRFPEQLAIPVLKSVQWQLVGRLDHLVEAVYDRFKDRYFEGERVFIDFNTGAQDDDHRDHTTSKSRYWARITAVTPPARAKPANGKRKLAQMENGGEEPAPLVHDIYGDLKIPAAQVNAADDPKSYLYRVQLADEGLVGHPPEPVTVNDFRHGGNVMTVRCDVMSRDRLAFSKSILKRFIRECVDRDAAVASPWIVKKEVAAKYDINLVMPDDIRKDVDAVKKTETEKRKKISETRESPPKKVKRRATNVLLTEEEKVEMEREEEALRTKKAKDEAHRLATIGCRRQVNRWPIEDLDVQLTEKEKASGKAVMRPPLHRVSEFPAPEMFEKFLMSWVYITTFASAFNITPFTLDDLEATLKHTGDDYNPLIDVVHAAMISSCRSISAGATTRPQAAVTSLQQLADSQMETDQEDPLGVKFETLMETLTVYGGGWEKKAVNPETWVNAMVCILKEHATLESVPQLREIITHLLFAPFPSTAGGEAQNGDDQRQGWQSIKPRLRYKTLSFAYKIAILAFICELSTGTKAIHGFLETCESSLTEMRKEKVELKKQHKKASDQLTNMAPKKKKKVNGVHADGATVDGSEKSDQETEGGGDAASDEAPPSSDGGSSTTTPTGSGRPTRGPRTSLRFRAQSQSNLAKQAAEKTAPAKSPTKGSQEKIDAKVRELEEQVAKLDAQIESLEVEFRQYAYISRMRPIGKDRFHYKVWWFDGVGALALLNAEGETQHGTGKLFIQGPGVDEQGMIAKKIEDDPSVSIRRQLEDGPSMLGLDEWGWYETPEEIQAFFDWLNTKGTRENQMEKAIVKWKDHLLSGMKQRLEILHKSVHTAELRRTGKRTDWKEPYLLYENRFGTRG